VGLSGTVELSALAGLLRLARDLSQSLRTSGGGRSFICEMYRDERGKEVTLRGTCGGAGTVGACSVGVPTLSRRRAGVLTGALSPPQRCARISLPSGRGPSNNAFFNRRLGGMLARMTVCSCRAGGRAVFGLPKLPLRSRFSRISSSPVLELESCRAGHGRGRA